MQTLTLANTGGTPYLGVSRYMGTIVGVCIILIVIAFVVSKLRKNKR